LRLRGARDRRPRAGRVRAHRRANMRGGGLDQPANAGTQLDSTAEPPLYYLAPTFGRNQCRAPPPAPRRPAALDPPESGRAEARALSATPRPTGGCAAEFPLL